MQLTVEDREQVRKYLDMYGAPTLVANEHLEDFIDDAADTVSASYFGKQACKAVAYLTLHNLCVSNDVKQSGGGGERIASKTIGPVTVTYKDMGRHVSEYTATSYGRLFLSLVKKQGGCMGVNNSWRAFK